jgi:hypothetical protein
MPMGVGLCRNPEARTMSRVGQRCHRSLSDPKPCLLGFPTHTFNYSVFLHCSKTVSETSRTAVYGPARTVVWKGSASDCRPYAHQTQVELEIVRLRRRLES